MNIFTLFLLLAISVPQFEISEKCDRLVEEVYSDKPVSASELRNAGDKCVRIVKNTVFAKYGYSFKDSDLRTYFSAKKWYSKKNVDISTINYSSVDLSNLSTISFLDASKPKNYFVHESYFTGDGEVDPFISDKRMFNTTINNSIFGQMFLKCNDESKDGSRDHIVCELCKDRKCTKKCNEDTECSSKYAVADVRLNSSRRVLKVIGVTARLTCCFGPTSEYQFVYNQTAMPLGVMLKGDFGARPAARTFDFIHISILKEEISALCSLDTEKSCSYDWGDLESDGFPEAIVDVVEGAEFSKYLITIRKDFSNDKFVADKIKIGSQPNP